MQLIAILTTVKPTRKEDEKKVTRARNVKCISDRLKGIAVWKVTGPSVVTGERVTIEVEGTRETAEKTELA